VSGFTEFSDLEKAVATGVYLSKFDKQGLDEFGFTGFGNAYNVLGYSLGVLPKSIQNYRDEFDPVFPNPRKGWRNRKLRTYCKKVLDLVDPLSVDDFTRLVKTFVIKDYDAEQYSEKAPNTDTWANRLATGGAAEEYFRLKYAEETAFSGFAVKDTTKLGCGFDFKLKLLTAVTKCYTA